MAWLKMDDGFASHPKLAALTDRQFRIWVRLLCYLSRYRSDDGEVTAEARREIAGLSPQMLARFEALLLLDRDEKVLRVHDWNDYQPKRDSTVTERVRRFRERHGNAVTEGVPNAVTSRARVPVPSQEALASPPNVVQLAGSDAEASGGSATQRLHNLAPNEADRAKLDRAMQGAPEADLLEALHAANGKGVRDKLAAALARLSKLRRERAVSASPARVTQPSGEPKPQVEEQGRTNVVPSKPAEAVARMITNGAIRDELDLESECEGFKLPETERVKLRELLAGAAA